MVMQHGLGKAKKKADAKKSKKDKEGGKAAKRLAKFQKAGKLVTFYSMRSGRSNAANF